MLQALHLLAGNLQLVLKRVRVLANVIVFIHDGFGVGAKRAILINEGLLLSAEAIVVGPQRFDIFPKCLLFATKSGIVRFQSLILEVKSIVAVLQRDDILAKGCVVLT